MTNRKIASLLNVSASYVSKVKTGKKTSYIPVINTNLVKNDMIENYTNITDVEVINYLESQIESLQIQIHVYNNILRRLKKDANTKWYFN